MSDNEDACKCIKETAVSDTKCIPEDPEKLIRKLVNLMYHPISSDQYDRQITLLKDLVGSTKDGFWVSDLSYVVKMFEALFQRVAVYCRFRKPLMDLLAVCSMPPLLKKSSNSFVLGGDIEEYFSFFGRSLIDVQDVEIQNLFLKTLLDLLKRRRPTALNCIDQRTFYESIEKSELPVSLTQLLEIADPVLYKKLLDISLILTNQSYGICHKMIKKRGLDIILLRLMESSEDNDGPLPKNYDISCKILWSLLSSCKEECDFKIEEYCPSHINLKNVRELLRALILNKNPVNRNYVMGIILQFLDLFPNLPLISSGLASDIGILCAATEIGSGGTWLSGISFGSNPNDFEFKKMLILTVCYSAKIRDALKILHPKRIIPSLLRIISPEVTHRWHPQQLEKLISMAVSALRLIVETSPDYFIHSNGPVRFLTVIEYYYKLPNEGLLKDSLKALHSIISLNNDDVLNDILIHGAQHMLMDLCLQLLNQRTLTLCNQQCLTYAFVILEKICNSEIGFEIEAVCLCMTFLKRVLYPNASDPLLDPKFLISGINFLWESMVWSEICLRKFTSDGGVYMLLDIICKCPLPVKIVTLGALVDMCDIGFCIPHLITWRNNGQKLLPLLLELFRQENVILGVKSTSDGTIADIEIPLMGQQQWYETFNVGKDPNSSPATVDLLGSCRPKIYAIINLLTNRHEARVNVSNDHYRLFDLDSLNTIDKITLLLAENFLALKLGEIWVEVSEDIHKSGIRPLPIDEAFITHLKRRFIKWSQHIRICQDKLLKKELIQEFNQDVSLYNMLRDSKLIESLKALRELDYIARTTESMFRLMSKRKQCDEIESTQYSSENGVYHSTYFPQLKVTPIFQQNIIMQSDVISNTNKNDLVSLRVSVCSSKDKLEM